VERWFREQARPLVAGGSGFSQPAGGAPAYDPTATPVRPENNMSATSSMVATRADALLSTFPDPLSAGSSQGLRETADDSKNCSMRLGSVTSLLSSSSEDQQALRPKRVLYWRCWMRRVSKVFLCSVPSGAKEPGGFDGGPFWRVLGAVRSGHGPNSSLAAPVSGAADAPVPRMAREKHVLQPFSPCANPRLDPRSVTDGLARLIFGSRGRGLWPILFDQSKAGCYTSFCSQESLFKAGPLPLAGLHFPISVAGKKTRAPARISLEEVFLLADIRDRLAHSCAAGVHWGSWLCAGSAAPPAVESSRSSLHHSWTRGHGALNTRGRSCKLGRVCLVRIRRAIRYLPPSGFIKRASVSRSMLVVYSRSGIPGTLVVIGSQSEQRPVTSSRR